MTGDLTIKGITRSVALQMTRLGEFNDPMMGHRIGYSGSAKINRKDFGLTFNPVLDGRFVVSDEIDITLEGELVEQPEEAERPNRQRPADPSPHGPGVRRTNGCSWPGVRVERFAPGRDSVRMARPQTQYAKSGPVSIAYQVVGDGPTTWSSCRVSSPTSRWRGSNRGWPTS